MIPTARAPLSESYQIQQELPSGFLGPTVIVQHRESGATMICKICRKSFIGGPDKLKSFRSRITTLQLRPFSFVVAFTDLIETDDEFFIMRPFIEQPTLAELVDLKRRELTNTLILDLWRRITICVAGLHQAGIFPSSIKPSNIFINDDGSVLLTDLYELSSDVSWALQTPDPGQLAFLAPEFFDRTVPPSTYSDVWSLGVILYYMAMGTLPFSTKNVFVMIKSITETPFVVPPSFPREAVITEAAVMVKAATTRPPCEYLSDPIKIRMFESRSRRVSDPVRSVMQPRLTKNVTSGTVNRKPVRSIGMLATFASQSGRAQRRAASELKANAKPMTTSCFVIRCRFVKPQQRTPPPPGSKDVEEEE